MHIEVMDTKEAEAAGEESAVTEESMITEAAEDEENSETEQLEEEEPFEGPKDVGGFTVLGDYKAKEKKAVQRVLPNWLQHPKIITNKEVKDFSDITELDADLVEKLQENSLTKCFPVQWNVIPELLAQCRCGLYAGDAGFRPRDICVSAPTGSGKTLTFVLPIIQALKNRVVPHVRALVILPVKDLALQVYNVFKKYCDGTSLKVCLVAGRKDFASEQKQLVRERPLAASSEKWISNADIVVATKGRLLDHIDRTEGFDLSHLRFLVVDEADRQMEDIYDEWLNRVEQAAYTVKPGAYAPYRREKQDCLTVASSRQGTMHMQKLLFSATLSQNPEKLEQMSLFLPLLFTMVSPGSKPSPVSLTDGGGDAAMAEQSGEQGENVDQFSTPDLLTENFISCQPTEKPLLLLHFVLTLKYRQVLCFTNTVEAAHRLHLLMKQIPGIKVGQLSSNVHTEKRERIIRKFMRGDIQLLICSDVMTRGMDIENVEYVISYDAPSHIEKYIHRVGRTARANKSGTAITLIHDKEAFHFKKMLKEAGRWNKLTRVPVGKSLLEPLLPQYTKALKVVPEILKTQRRQKKEAC